MRRKGLHLNRRQRRQLQKKIDREAPPSLAEWLTETGKLVKRGELWAVLMRFWALKRLEDRYNRPLARVRRFFARLLPWAEDPPPSPFEQLNAAPERDIREVAE